MINSKSKDLTLFLSTISIFPKTAADEALVQAQQAVKAVEANKVKMKADAEQLVIDIQNSMNEVKTSVSETIRKKAKISQLEIQSAIGKWEIELVSIKENLQIGKVRSAFDELKSLQEQVKLQKETISTALDPKAAEKNNYMNLKKTLWFSQQGFL